MGYFGATSELRQGDTLSRFLFTLVVDRLSAMVERASQVSLLKGLFVGREELEITYLQFEDDTRFFLSGEGQNLRSLLLI